MYIVLHGPVLILQWCNKYLSCILFGKHTKMVDPGHCVFKETTVNLECIIRTATITVWYSNSSSVYTFSRSGVAGIFISSQRSIKHHSGTHCRTSCPVMKYVLWNLLSWKDFSHALSSWRVIKDTPRVEWKGSLKILVTEKGLWLTEKSA